MVSRGEGGRGARGFWESRLEVMCRCVDGRVVLVPVLAGAIEHKNPKVRGRCFVLLQALFCDGDRGRAVDRLVDAEGVLRRLVVACDRGSTDNTPEAREGAREVLCWATATE